VIHGVLVHPLRRIHDDRGEIMQLEQFDRFFDERRLG
jgi:hypothetical protein